MIDTATNVVIDAVTVGENPGDVAIIPGPPISHVGGSVSGMTVTHGWVLCANATTHQVVRIRLDDSTSWDCEAAGLAVNAGDQIRLGIFVKAHAIGYGDRSQGNFTETATAIIPGQTMDGASRGAENLIRERIADD